MTPPGPTLSGDFGPIARLLDNGTLRPPRKPGLLAQLGKYDVLRVIGEGGMGIVVEAVNAENESVAVKFLRPGLAGDQGLRQQFLREVQIMTDLNVAAGKDNPWFLPILQSNESAPSPWFVTPMMRRGSLASKLAHGQGLGVEEMIRITQQTAAGLRFAHEKGILHRDLKLANILLDDAGNARLTDFGLARGFSGDSIFGIQAANLVGTPAYMSPATAEGKAEDTRCGIYSLGAVLYEMLTGNPPYSGGTAAQTLDQIRSGPPEPILKRSPKASPELAKVAEKAMARALADRYASMDYLLKDLERVKQGKPAGAPWPWAALEWLRWRVRAKPALAVAGLAVLAGLVALWHWLTPSIRRIDQFTLAHHPSSGITLFENEGRPALAYLEEGNLFVYSPVAKGGRLVPLKNFPTDCVNRPFLTMVGDADGDRSLDYWIAWSEEGDSLRENFWKCTAQAVPYNLDGFRVSPLLSLPGFKYRTPTHRETATAIFPLKFIAKGASGGPGLLARAYTSWGTNYSPAWNVFPRGLACFDAHGGGLLWSNALACPSGDIALADLDGDGRQEILLGSSSPHNGFKLIDGTDDSHCYLYVFSISGEFLWRRELSDELNSVTLVIPKSPAPGEPRVYAWVSGGHANRWEFYQKAEVGRILAFDARGKELQQRDFGTSLQSFLTADLNGDGKDELLAADRFGRVHVLDSKLNLLAMHQIVDTNGTRFVHSVNLDEVRACTNLIAHWDYTRVGGENGPPPGQTNNCQHLKAHGYTNFADRAQLEFIGMGKMRRSGGPTLAMISRIAEYQTAGTLRTLGNDSRKTTEVLLRSATLHFLDNRLRPVAKLVLDPASSPVDYAAFLIDWENDGLHEVLLNRGRDVEVLKLD